MDAVYMVGQMKEYSTIECETIQDFHEAINENLARRWELHSFVIRPSDGWYVAVLWRNQ